MNIVIENYIGPVFLTNISLTNLDFQHNDKSKVENT